MPGSNRGKFLNTFISRVAQGYFKSQLLRHLPVEITQLIPKVPTRAWQHFTVPTQSLRVSSAGVAKAMVKVVAATRRVENCILT